MAAIRLPLCLVLLILLGTAKSEVQNLDGIDFLEEDAEDTAVASRSLFHKRHSHNHHHRQQPSFSTGSAGATFVPVRVESQRIIKEYSCAVGMTLVGQQCVGRQFSPPQHVCPSGTKRVDGSCISNYKPVVECPSGYQLQNRVCKGCDIFPAEMTCPRNDEVLEGNGCVRRVSAAPYCPAGFSMSGGDCVQTVPGVEQCPPEYRMCGRNQCVRSSTSPATIVCPDGADLNPETQKCVAYSQSPPRCPRKFTFFAESHSCVQPVAEIPAPCPPGFRQTGSSCQQSTSHPGEPFCNAGYEYDGDRSCTREVHVASRCPQGYQHSRTSSTHCEKIVPELSVCPMGTTKSSGNQCERTVELAVIQTCAPGFELVGGECEGLETSMPTLFRGRHRNSVRTSRVSFACPDDMQFVDDARSPTCVSEMPAECRAPVYNPPPRCRALSSLRASSPEARALSMDPACQAPPVPQCSHKQEVMVAQSYCPEGGEVRGNQCAIEEPDMPEMRCDVGELSPDTGLCVRRTTSPARSECPPGTRRQGHVCIMKERVQPDFVCPENSETGPNGSCVVRVALVQSRPTVERASASFRCSSGRLSGDGRTCVEETFAPAEMICPPGSETSNYKNHRCVITAEMILPQAVERIVRSSYICPDGSRASGSTCQIEDIVSTEVHCPSGAQAGGEGGQCVRSVSPIHPPERTIVSVPVPVCPAGSVSKGTTCVAVREVPPVMTCRDEYYLQNELCVRSLPIQSFCPAGTTETADGCMRETVSSPQVKIVKGCVHEVQSTCDGCPRSVSSQCHSG